MKRLHAPRRPRHQRVAWLLHSGGLRGRLFERRRDSVRHRFHRSRLTMPPAARPGCSGLRQTPAVPAACAISSLGPGIAASLCAIKFLA